MFRFLFFSLWLFWLFGIFKHMKVKFVNNALWYCFVFLVIVFCFFCFFYSNSQFQIQEKTLSTSDIFGEFFFVLFLCQRDSWISCIFIWRQSLLRSSVFVCESWIVCCVCVIFSQFQLVCLGDIGCPSRFTMPWTFFFLAIARGGGEEPFEMENASLVWATSTLTLMCVCPSLWLSMGLSRIFSRALSLSPSFI